MSDLALSRAVAVLTFTALTRPIARSSSIKDASSDCQLSSAMAPGYFLVFLAGAFFVVRSRVGARGGA